MSGETTLTIRIRKGRIAIDNEMMNEGIFIEPCYAIRYLEYRLLELTGNGRIYDH